MHKLLFILILLIGCSSNQKINTTDNLKINKTSENIIKKDNNEILIWHATNGEEILPAIKKSFMENKMIFVYIYDIECKECFFIENSSFRNKKLIKLLNKDFISTKLYIRDKVVNIKRAPLIIIYSYEGEAILQINGYISGNDLKEVLEGLTILWHRNNSIKQKRASNEKRENILYR